MNLTDQFSGKKYINLESFTKNGQPKQTPAQSLEHDGLIYVRTDPSTWKVKRIKRDSHVRLVLSDRSGKPTGTWVNGEAHMLDDEEKDLILNVFRKEYGGFGYSMVGLVGRMRGERHMTAIISIKLQPP